MRRRNHPASQLIIGVVVTVLLFNGDSLAQEKTDWKARFFAEAPKRWEEYIRFAHSLQITCTANVYVGADRSLQRSIRTEYKQAKGASLRIVDRKIGAKSQAEVEGINPSYSFKLKRRSPDSGWIITDLDVSDQNNSSSDEQRKREEDDFQLIACSCLTLGNLLLPTLIQDPDFKITAITAHEIDGLPLVRFAFDYLKRDEEYPRKAGIWFKGGWMVLDPEHDWILREYLVHRGNPEAWFAHRTLQIREGTGRHPVITHGTQQIFYKPEKQSEKTSNAESQWEVVERTNVPLEEFTVSAFGLPEPPGIQVERSSRLYLWIALGGITCLGIAALIRWQIRRRRMAA